MSQLRRLRLLFWTLRYLQPSQIRARASRTIRRRWANLRGQKAPQPPTPPLASTQPLWQGRRETSRPGAWSSERDAAIERARNVAQGKFHFLNQEVEFAPDKIGWNDPNLNQLWRYHLHYFDYVRELAIWADAGESAGEADAAYEAFKTLAISWIENNRAIAGDGWHPYTISLRAVNWLHATAVFSESLARDEAFRARLLSSLCGQAQVLFNDLELDVRGNHLLENLRALIWLGFAFEGAIAQRWRRRGLQLLQVEIAEQIESDGGHFERSPGYHLVVLKDCLEIALWLRRNAEVPAWLDDTLRRMLDYLLVILPPDGNVPLLKDTAWDAAPRAADLLAAGALYFDEPRYKRDASFGLYPLLLSGAEGAAKFESWPLDATPVSSRALEASGHYVMRDDARGDYLILDAGRPCPDYLPAHAHADIFSFELLLGGRRVIVDSGVQEYAPGAWRDYYRSTRAHNTVEVAGANQSEVWGSFRVARRARVGNVVWQNTPEYCLVGAQHDGYQRLNPPVTHRRTLLWQKRDFWLIADELWGEEIAADSHIHLHPDFAWTQHEDDLWRAQGEENPLWLRAFGHQSSSIVRDQMEPTRQGWHSEKFGQSTPASVLTLHGAAQKKLCFGYVLSTDEPARIEISEANGEPQIRVDRGERQYSLRLGDTPEFSSK